jgi:hypothetical protein
MANGFTYDEAMRLAKDIIRRRQNNGVPLQQLVKNIMLPPDPGQTVRPEAVGRAPFPQGAGGIGGVFQPVMAAPEPVKVVTPAAPAPVQEGVEIKAPPTPQRYENPYFLLARQQQQRLEAMAAPGENATPDQIAQYDLLKAKAARAQAEAEATEAAKIRPEEEKIFSAREARTGEKLAELEKDRKSSKWKALAEAGFKMAQSNSPYFMQALASGMEAGVKGYDERKANMDERKSLLQEQKENVDLGRLRAIDAARAQALDLYRSGNKAAGEELQALNLARENVVSGKTAGARIETANLAPKVAQAEIAQKEASATRDLSAAGLADRTDPNLRSTGGYGAPGTVGINPKNASPVLSNLIKQESTYAKIAADRFAPKDQRDAAAKELKKVRMDIAWLKASLGFSGGASAAPTGGGALTPDAVYDPKTGYRPLK